MKLPDVKAIVIAMEHEDSSFIEKSVAYLSSLEGARQSDISVLTNSRLPKRYLFTIKNLPLVNLDDLMHVSAMSTFVKHIEIDLNQKLLKFDCWKKKGKTSRKRERSLSPICVIDKNIEGINLDSLHDSDKQIALRIINAIYAMPSVVCQFRCRSLMLPPNSYMLDMKIKDNLNYARLKQLLNTFRAFVESVSINFPQQSLQIKIKRLD